MAKKTCIIYNSWGDIIRALPAEMAGELTKAILAYAFDGEEPEIDNPALAASFAMMRKKLDEDSDSYNRKVENLNKNKAGQKEVNQNSDRNQTEIRQNSDRKQEEIDSVSVSVSDSVSVSESDREPKTEVTGDARAVIDAWNSLPDAIPKVKAISGSGSRAQLLKARIREYGTEEVIAAIENIKRSDFLQGKTGKGWRITFDWFIAPNNFKKVYEGNYNTEEVKSEKRYDELDRIYAEAAEAFRQKAQNNNSGGGNDGGGARSP